MRLRIIITPVHYTSGGWTDGGGGEMKNEKKLIRYYDIAFVGRARRGQILFFRAICGLTGGPEHRANDVDVKILYVGRARC